MTDDRKSDELPEHLARSLREQAQALPADTAQQLAQARHAAVRASERLSWSTRLLGQRWPLTGAVAGAGAAVALAVVLLGDPDGEIPVIPVSTASELAAAQELEVLEQLEFLAWLEEEGNGAG